MTRRLFARSPRLSHLIVVGMLIALGGCDERTQVLVGHDAGPDEGPIVDAAVDSYNLGWEPTKLSDPGDVYALWASEDGSRVWAAGRRAPKSPMLWRFDGERFVDASPAALTTKQSELWTLWGSADGKLWTSSREPTMPPWYCDGASWRETTGLPPDMESIAQIRGYGATPWLVGHSTSGSVVARWDAAAWVPQLLEGGDMLDIVPLGPNRAVATGYATGIVDLPGAVWQLDGAWSQATKPAPLFHLGCPLSSGEVLLLGSPELAKDWARWNAADGLLPWQKDGPQPRIAATCWDGHAFVVTQGIGGFVLEADGAQALVIGYPPDDASLEPAAQMAVSRTDIWLAGSSRYQIWRRRRLAP